MGKRDAVGWWLGSLILTLFLTSFSFNTVFAGGKQKTLCMGASKMNG